MMIYLAIYIILVLVLLAWWKAAHDRTPYEEWKDREEEAKYWMERNKK